jgi:hypothetical protein
MVPNARAVMTSLGYDKGWVNPHLAGPQRLNARYEGRQASSSRVLYTLLVGGAHVKNNFLQMVQD